MTHTRSFAVAVVPAAVALVSLLAAPAALAQSGPNSGPQKVYVVNQTRFEPIVQDAVIPAGETARFEVRGDGFAMASVLIAGSTTPGSGALGVTTLFGPPFVLTRAPQRLMVGPQGHLQGHLATPVLGPVMVIAIHNESSADAVVSLSAYLSN